MLPVCLGGVFFASWSKVRKDEYWIRIPARTSSGVFSTCYGGWFWSDTRACLVRPLRSFRGRSMWCFRCGAFSSCSGGLLMSGANMSVVRCAVVKGFARGCTSKTYVTRLACRALSSDDWDVISSWVNRFSQRVHSYSLSPVWMRWCFWRWLWRVKVLSQVSQWYSLRGFLAGGSPSQDWISYN